MITIELTKGGCFQGNDIESAKKKYINFHTDRGIDASAIKEIYSEEEDYSREEIKDLFSELEEEVADYNKEAEEESSGLALSQEEALSIINN